MEVLMLTSVSLSKHSKSTCSQFPVFVLTLLTLSLVFLLSAGKAYPGQATLSWDPPTTNADGTPLTDLSGYKVYHGATSGNYSQIIDVSNVTTYTVANLTAGLTYYFAATAYDALGNESGYSNEVSKTIPSTQQYTLNITKVGTGSGTVTSSPAGINCGNDCTETYNAGNVVTLNATPNTNSTFTGWSGGGCTGTGTCSISINSNTTLTANFVTNTNIYTITASAETGGIISPSGSVSVNYGLSQTFTITPDTKKSGGHQSNYGIANVLVDGNSVGAVTTYTLTNVTANHTISASFATNTYNLSATKVGTGTGAVTSSPAGINCGSVCSYAYNS